MTTTTDCPFTSPTHRRLHGVLADGRCHTKPELDAQIEDGMAGPRALSFHLTYMRRGYRAVGQDVAVLQIAGVVYYQLVDYSPHGYTVTHVPTPSPGK